MTQTRPPLFRLSRRQWLAGGLTLAAAGVGGALGWQAWRSRADEPPVIRLGDGITTPKDMAWVPGGVFQMGSDHNLSYPNERPAHAVRVGGFWMDLTHVTNDQFARFVQETGYITTAQQTPDWDTIRVQLPPGTPRPPDHVLVPGAMVFVGTHAPVNLSDYYRWWRYTPGADWRHPQGPGSNITDKGDHPVVQVSHADALAYAAWAGKRLPTEAEWEFAARGGLEQATYAWGDELLRDGQRQAHYWETQERAFPVISPQAGGATGTLSAGSFPPNGYGLLDMTGNAWQWVADWYRVDYFMQQANLSQRVIENPQGPAEAFDPDEPGTPPNAPKRVIRGGSFLCNEDYCMSYRPSARRGADPYSPMSHLGFRLVKA